MSINVYTPDSSSIIHETKVDFSKRSVQTPIHIVQYDKSLPIIAVHLYYNGSKYALPSDVDYVRIRFGKKDHTYVNTDALGCNEDRTIVYFEVIDQMTVIYGEYNPVLEIIVGTKVACSSYFPVCIDRNPIQDGDVESHVEPSIVDQLRAEIADCAKDNTVVHLTGDEVIDGQKEFLSGIKLNSNLAFDILARTGDAIYRFTTTFFAPRSDNVRDAGESDKRFRDVFVGRNLSDGTNSATVAEITGGIIKFFDAPNSGVPTGLIDALRAGNICYVNGNASNPDIQYKYGSMWFPTKGNPQSSDAWGIGYYYMQANHEKAKVFQYRNGGISSYGWINLDNIQSINKKNIPNYPSDTTKQYKLVQKVGGELDWIEDE